MIFGTQENPLPMFKNKWTAAKLCDQTTLLAVRRSISVSKFKDNIPRPY